MIVPMIDQSLAQARALVGAPNGVAPPTREKFTAADGRTFAKVPAKEWRRLLNESLPRVNLLLLTESEEVSGAVPVESLTVTFTLTHYGCGDTRTLTRVEPLPPAPSRSLAKQWAHTRAVNAMARTLLWQWDDEDEDETEGQAPASTDTRTWAQRQEDERREKKGLEPYHRNGNGSRRSTKATRATAALADATIGERVPVSVELGDVEREQEAAMDAEAARLAAQPSSLPQVADPGWLDEPKAQAHPLPVKQPASSPDTPDSSGVLDSVEEEATPTEPAVGEAAQHTSGGTPADAGADREERSPALEAGQAEETSSAALPPSSPGEAPPSPGALASNTNHQPPSGPSPSPSSPGESDEGRPTGAPPGGEIGAVSEPPAEPARSAGVPLASKLAQGTFVVGGPNPSPCGVGGCGKPATSFDAMVPPHVWCDAHDPAPASDDDAEPLHPRVGESAEDDDEIAARNGCSCDRCKARRATDDGAGAPPAPSYTDLYVALSRAAWAASRARSEHGDESPIYLEAKAKTDAARERLRAAATCEGCSHPMCDHAPEGCEVDGCMCDLSGYDAEAAGEQGEDDEPGPLAEPSPEQVNVVSNAATLAAAGPADLRGQRRERVLAKAAEREWSPVVVKRGGGTCAALCGVAFKKGDEAEESGNRRRHKACPGREVEETPTS